MNEQSTESAEVGIAVLFSGDPETGQSSMDVFREDDDTTLPLDPYHRAAALRDSCAEDFPTRLWSIAVNDRARDLMRDARMAAMGFPPGETT